MRKFLILCFPFVAVSQIFLPPFDPQLQSYLNLNQSQAEQLQKNFQDLFQHQQTLSNRLGAVSRELADETQKPSPNAFELGIRYQEIETMCRELEDPRRETHQKQLQILTPEQRTRALALGEALQLAPLAFLASSLFLLPPEPQSGNRIFNGTSFQGPAGSGINVPPDLAGYLSLSLEQLERVRSAQQEYQRFYTTTLNRAAQVTRELDAEFSLELPAAQSLGERYVELETMRRETYERENTLRSELRSIMNSPQRTLLDTLETARTQLQLASTANYYLILRPQSRRPASNSIYIANFRSTSLSFGVPFLQVIYRSCGIDVTPGFSLAFGGDAQSVRQ